MIVKLLCMVTLVGLVSSELAHSSLYVHRYDGHAQPVYKDEQHKESKHHEEVQDRHEQPKHFNKEPKHEQEQTKHKQYQAKHEKIELAQSSQYIHRHDGHAQPVFVHKHEEHKKQEHHGETLKHHEETKSHLEQHKHEEKKEHHQEQLVDYNAHSKYEYEYKVDDPHTGDHKQQHEHYDGHDTTSDYSLHVKHIVPKHHEKHERRR